jgi:uncharacterized protein
MTKPSGPICNLGCRYCFYLEKEKLYPESSGPAAFRMSDAVLENYIRQYLAQQDAPEINFAWQGGEPTLMGLGFFRRVVELQARYCPPGKRIRNALQTNGTLLDDAWCEFFHAHEFLIGLSLDGPKDLHDCYRVNKAGHGTFDAVLRGLERLKAHRVEFNTLTVVHREVARKPLEVYEFLKSIGSRFMQFIPLVERVGPGDDAFAAPPRLKVLTPQVQVTPWTVVPEDLGEFYCQIFDYWVQHDVGRWFVQLFDVQLGIEMGLGSSLCVFSPTCGRGLALEHNGDLYACDHYVYPQFKLGNIAEESLAAMVESPAQRKFGTDKRDALPGYCRRCPVLEHCQGECPKHRFAVTPDGEAGLNYLCPGYQRFFAHIQPHLRTMAALLRSGRPADEIMGLLAQQEGRATAPPATPILRQLGSRPGRNDLCPCGSGRKYKKCCGR